ncbi:MAG: phosphotransferase [Coriobacteriales bacterium]|nr:phosphotransferase [Coriobacteriales bacterium]
MDFEVTLVSKDEHSSTLELSGRITAGNAGELEKSVDALIAGQTKPTLTIDVENLDYISSAGLRVVMRLRKKSSEVNIVNASAEVYDIFEITGFTQIANVSRAARSMSVEGCKAIGRGGFATVYRTDPETIVKVYIPSCSRAFVDEEREMARRAFVMGVPTAIPYDLVKVGDSYGLVFELLDCKTVAELLAEDPSRMHELAQRMMGTLKEIHEIEVPEGTLHDRTELLRNWFTDTVGPYLTAEEIKLITDYLDSIPHTNTFLHGDYHCKNVVEVNGELMLIDIGDAAAGNPVYDVAQTALSLLMLPKSIEAGRMPPDVLGFDVKLANPLWRDMLKCYFETDDEDEIDKIQGMIMPLVMMLTNYIGGQHSGNTPEHSKNTAENAIRTRTIPILRKVPRYML